MSEELILQMRGITKAFPGVLALDGVDFDLCKGEVHVLLGENGAGKSTLMKILSGAYSKDSGEILFDGRPIEITSPKHAQEMGISTIYQEFNLIPFLTAGENIFLGNEPETFSGVIDQKKLFLKAQQLLGQLGVHFDARTPVRSLGVAQQQMVEVAKALSFEAKVLIMDEPTSALTESEIEELFQRIRKLKSQGVAIVYISHRLEELFEIGDRVTVLRDGKYIATRSIREASRAELVRLIANRDLEEHFPRRSPPPGEELLRVEGLQGKRIRDIGLSLRRGEILGVSGLLGSGRTELARTLFGAEQPAAGRIFVRGREVRIPSPRKAIQLGMGFLPEDRKTDGLVLILSVKDNIALPNIHQFSRFGVVDSAAEEDLVKKSVGSLVIKTPSIHQKVLFLSGGNQQKVVLSKWLAGRADVLIFDEPTRGIDVGSKVEIYELMNELTARGAGILMISSELPEVLGMSDRILVMHEGRITARFNRREATQERVLAAALGEPVEGPVEVYREPRRKSESNETQSQ